MDQAILIDADKREVRVIDCTYQDMKTYLPGGICLGWTFPDDIGGDVLYVDDEALLRKAERAFRWKLRPDGQPMMSHGIITGRDDSHMTEDGDIVTVTLRPYLRPQQIATLVEWLTVEEALAWFRERAEQPSQFVDFGEGKRQVLGYWRDHLRTLTGG